MQGTVCGSPAVVKIFTLEGAALSFFTNEVSAYLALQQEPCILPLLAVGRLPHTGRPMIALAEGQPLPEPLTSELRAEAEAALHELHHAGWCHGDIKARNMLMYNGRVVFCDLETCGPCTEAGRDEDMQALQSMLQ